MAEAEAAALLGPPTGSGRLHTVTEPARELQRNPTPIRCTLVAAFCWQRPQELLDRLIKLVLQVIYRIRVGADAKIVRELTMASEPCIDWLLRLFSLVSKAEVLPGSMLDFIHSTAT
jgi:hypothetical protein